MKKTFKIILLNLTIIVVIFLLMDFYYLCKSANALLYKDIKKNFSSPVSSFKYYIKRYHIYFKRFINYKDILDSALIYDIENRYRPVENKDSTKNSIVIFGCSFAYGDFLKDDETFSYNLAKNLNVPVYNRAYSGRGLSHMLYQLKNDIFYKQIKTKPDYLIYLYMHHHPIRIFTTCNFFNSGGIYSEPNVLYDYTNGSFKLKTYPVFETASPLVHTLKYKYFNYYIEKPENISRVSNLILKYFLESKENMQKYWPDTKFVIIIYIPDKYIVPIIPELEENNFYIIYMPPQDILLTQQYSFPDSHPKPSVWTDFTSQIAEELKTL